MRLTQALSIVSMLALPLAAQAEERLLELEPKSSLAAAPVAVCDYLHEISPVPCRVWHVTKVTPLPPTPLPPTPTPAPELPTTPVLTAGSEIAVEDDSGKETLQVQWIGTNYYLDNGEVMLAKAHEASTLSTLMDLGAKKSRTVTGWVDTDGNGALSLNDRISLEGKESKIVDVRSVVSVVSK
ncbi:uncharacterized protein STAUR_5529 [Stigmatella aurantiaca DW4/3-1]|uniref:DUF4115 domain-containing protein n=1 Tax=Stigmatella aurantiaca (strain DW4/3-1) TaxID=378806 RepID=Q08VA6_STIAD|nr:uncharacterized protein STAUR_5529 [Stigmatella aurantiaca DW4/3-1]EAU64409.1 hypothetical protein STIAU_5488 [Stigmatella aurantiaca DW4/3-1]